jgi:hypothetical protein
MNRKTAEQVLEEIKARYADYLPYSQPNLRDNTHEELSEGSWSIDWEDGPDEWCLGYRTEVPGVFVEPIFSFVLGVYDR